MDTMLRVAWIEPSFVICLKIGNDVGLFRALSDNGRDGRNTVPQLAKPTGSDPILLSKEFEEERRA